MSCPAPWVYSAAADVSGVASSGGAVGACVIPTSATGGCFSAFFTPTLKYKFIRGTVLGVQFGDVCAFGPASRPDNLNRKCRCTSTA